jgi:hypothetical protein
VAENGSVLYSPRTPCSGTRARRTRLLTELNRRGIYYQARPVIVATARTDEPQGREALKAARVTRELVYNRAALMLLAAGISKGQAVERVLRSLGLSFQDALAMFNTAALSFSEWGALLARPPLMLALEEGRKWVVRRH